MTPFSMEFWAGIGTALFCGSIIGLERQVRGKTAGIRTSILICLSTEIFIRLSTTVQITQGDSARVLGQIVTGVGFLGAGVIIAREGLVKGVTSAAVIWMLAAVGATIGYKEYTAAVVLAVLTVAVLTGIEHLESSVRSLRKGVHGEESESVERKGNRKRRL